MAAYPLTNVLRKGSQEEWLDDLVADRTVNGAVKVRALYSGKKRRFILHHLLNSTERATLQTFYDTNRLLTITMTWPVDNVTYTCVFAKPPHLSHGSVLSDVDVELLQI